MMIRRPTVIPRFPGVAKSLPRRDRRSWGILDVQSGHDPRSNAETREIGYGNVGAMVGSRAGAVLKEPVSSPRHLKLLVRISRKQLSCAFQPKGYRTYRAETPVDAE